MPKSIFVVIATIVVISVAVVAWLVTSRQAIAPTAVIPTVENSPIDTRTDDTQLPIDDGNGAAVIERPEQRVEQAILEPVGPFTGVGIASRTFKDEIFTVNVEASLTDPATGKFYEGWLVIPVPGAPEFISTGRLSKNDQDRYAQTYTNPEDLSRYQQVVITEETEANGLDNVPEAHVLEGEFQP